MEEEGFDVKIIHTKGILRRLLAKFRSRMNTIKCDNSKTKGLHRRILTIYSWTIFYILTIMCMKYPLFLFIYSFADALFVTKHHAYFCICLLEWCSKSKDVFERNGTLWQWPC